MKRFDEFDFDRSWLMTDDWFHNAIFIDEKIEVGV